MSVTTSVRVRSGNGRRKSGGSRTGGENGKPTQQHSYKKDARGDRMELPGNAQNGQPSELDKLVTIAKMAAAQLHSETTADTSMAGKPQLGAYVAGNSSSAEPMTTTAMSRAEMPLVSAAVPSPITVQDPAAVNVLQALVSQLQQKQMDESQPRQHLPAPPPLQPVASPAQAAPQQLHSLSMNAQQTALTSQAAQLPQLGQIQPAVVQHQQPMHQHDILRQVSQLQYPLLQVAPQTSSVSASGSQPVLASLAVNAAPMHINPYTGQSLGGSFGSNMTFMQHVAQPAMPQATLLPAQHLTSELLVKLEQLSQVNSMPGLAPLKPAQAPTAVQFQPVAAPVHTQLVNPLDSSTQERVAGAVSVGQATSTGDAIGSGRRATEEAKSPTSVSSERQRSPLSGAASAAAGTPKQRGAGKKRKSKTIRKSSHNVIEARYRLSINDRIRELRQRVAGNDAKVQKSAVLQLTLDKLKNVDDENDVLREENAALKDAHGSVLMQIHNLQSQLQAAGVAVDPSILEACQLPEALTRPLPPRGSSQGVQDGSIKTEGGLEDDDYEDDDDEDDEEEDDEQEYSRSGTRAAGFGNAS